MSHPHDTGIQDLEAPVVLVVPADPSFVRLARLVVSSLAADLAFDFDEIEDLRIAADELVSAAIGAAEPFSPVRIQLTTGQGVLSLEASAATSTMGAELDPLAAQIVEALVASHDVSTAGGFITVKFRSHTPGSSQDLA